MMEKYEIKKRLGVGAHGAVYLVQQKRTKKLFALKKIEVDERKKSRTKETVLKEASILSQLKHPHIVLFHECFLDPKDECVCLILDYCDGGSLAEKISEASQNGFTFTEKQIMQWFIQIVMAVQYIHSKHILHRDLKTENVFLNKRNVVKLGDFGISKILDNTIDVAMTVVGTPSYLSPELCQDIPYNSKSDIWATGCLLFEMYALYRPFDGTSLISLFLNIVKAEYKPLPADTPPGIAELVSQMLVKTPESRPSASAILNFPYVKQHLSSFIADTESIRGVRSRKNSPVVFAEAKDEEPSIPFNTRDERKRKTLSECVSPSVPTHQRPGKSEELARKHQSAPVPKAKMCWTEFPQGSKQLSKAQGASNIQEDKNSSDYSDDFDDSSSSEIEEELPKEADEVDGKSEDEPLYADDFEEYESDEDLNDVVKLAKEAQVMEPVDIYFFEDDDETSMLQTVRLAKADLNINMKFEETHL